MIKLHRYLPAFFALLTCWQLLSCTPDTPKLDLPGVNVLEQRLPLSAFSLQDHNKQDFSVARLKGRWTLAFFGYTHCPDICPNAMLVMNSVHQALSTSENFKDTQFVFFSVDPYRDSPDKLKEFIGYYNPQFIAVTGDTAELQKLTGLLGAYFDYSDPRSDEVWQDVGKVPPITDYVVNHAASIYLFDDKGRLVAYFLSPHDADRIVAAYTALRS